MKVDYPLVVFVGGLVVLAYARGSQSARANARNLVDGDLAQLEADATRVTEAEPPLDPPDSVLDWLQRQGQKIGDFFT